MSAPKGLETSTVRNLICSTTAEDDLYHGISAGNRQNGRSLAQCRRFMNWAMIRGATCHARRQRSRRLAHPIVDCCRSAATATIRL